MTDFLQSHSILDFTYLEDNIFGIWPEDVVWNAINELAEHEIMFIDMCDCEECSTDDEECDTEELLFNPEFIEKACPYFDCCPCCNPAPTHFNIIYN